jgi:2-hydroxy-3-oxopropionate reductase
MATIGFIGLGIMGQPMAGHLLAAGHSVCTSGHYKQPPAALIERGIEVVATAQAVAKMSEFIVTMLPDTPQVEHVLFGEDGVAGGIGPGKIVIDMSSISPIATREFARRIQALGGEYLDAPVSGGEVGAKGASLTIMVGGSEATFGLARPILEAMGKNITLIGANGDGQTAKVANQVIVALTIEAVAEGLLLASRAGADPVKVRTALMGGLASSRILELHGERMIKRTFNPGFRIRLHQKDLELALSTARSLSMSLPGTALCQQLFQACAANGAAESDHSRVVMALELLASHEVGHAGTTPPA